MIITPLETSITLPDVPEYTFSAKAQHEISTISEHPYFYTNKYNVVHEDVIYMYQFLQLGLINNIISLTSTETISLITEILGYFFGGISILYITRYIFMLVKYRTKVDISYILPTVSAPSGSTPPINNTSASGGLRDNNSAYGGLRDNNSAYGGLRDNKPPEKPLSKLQQAMLSREDFKYKPEEPTIKESYQAV